MIDINALAARVAAHLAGRPVIIKWQNPPASPHAAGETIKSRDGQAVVYVGELAGVETRLRVLLHELAHVRNDFSWMPAINPQKATVRILTNQERQAWRQDPRELRAKALGEAWQRYAARNAYKYIFTSQSAVEAQLRALLDWSE